MARDWVAEQTPHVVEQLATTPAAAASLVVRTALIEARQETVSELANFAQVRFFHQADLCNEIAVLLKDYAQVCGVRDRRAGDQ